MSETLIALAELIGASAGGGGIVAVANYVAARRKDRARTTEAGAKTEREALPLILGRLTEVEDRLDECEEARGEFQLAASECESKLEALTEDLAELRRDQEHLRASVSTPPEPQHVDP